MGVDIAMRKCDFFMAAGNKPAALETLKAVFPEETFFGEDKEYHPIGEASSLTDGLAALGWYPAEDDDGNIVSIGGGDGRTARILGMDVFRPLVPFVREGSSIEMHNEDEDTFYRWLFVAGGAVWQDGRVVYDE